jgi:anaerobic selenocysteine-containing dehydrogenase
MNAADAARLGLSHDDPVEVSNGHGRFEGRVFLAAIAPGNLQVHWPEGNVLVARNSRDAAGVPDYNATVQVARR